MVGGDTETGSCGCLPTALLQQTSGSLSLTLTTAVVGGK